MESHTREDWSRQKPIPNKPLSVQQKFSLAIGQVKISDSTHSTVFTIPS